MKKEDVQKLESVLKSRFFMAPTASIYGGASGFLDIGPVLELIKQNMIEEWRKHFLYFDDIYEVDTSIILPYAVLKASGHVDKFCDIVISDEQNGVSYRADHYIESVLKSKKQTTEIEEDLKNVDVLKCPEIDILIKKYNIKTPDGNHFRPAQPYNLMFETNVGLKNEQPFYLRPETAQGQFLNFRKLYELNNRKMPFGSASVGKAFRNEISPRSGLIRTREFIQAEIEYYVSPKNKTTDKFYLVKDLVLNLVENDTIREMTLHEAVSKKTIDNEILAYFIGRTFLFLLSIGIKKSNIRFRKHKTDEMAHYAKDCWDGEIYCTMGWIECVGIADRSAYDLTCHSKAANVDMTFSQQINPPTISTEWKPVLDKDLWIKRLKNRYENFKNSLLQLSSNDILSMIKGDGDKKYINFEYDGETIEVECKYTVTAIHEEKMIPDVIEPSFGIGRLLHMVLEHSFIVRNGRNLLSIPWKLAHIKATISYVAYHPDFQNDIQKLRNEFYENDVRVEVNKRTCSIGKKYASSDEVGVPFFITFDMETLSDKKVTIRERDSMTQVRVDIDIVVDYITKLLNGKRSWENN